MRTVPLQLCLFLDPIFALFDLIALAPVCAILWLFKERDSDVFAFWLEGWAYICLNFFVDKCHILESLVLRWRRRACSLDIGGALIVLFLAYQFRHTFMKQVLIGVLSRIIGGIQEFVEQLGMISNV